MLDDPLDELACHAIGGKAHSRDSTRTLYSVESLSCLEAPAGDDLTPIGADQRGVILDDGGSLRTSVIHLKCPQRTAQFQFGL